MRPKRAFLLSTIFAAPISAFYVPGWSIRSYADNEPVPLSTNKLTSDTSQLPYAYHEQPFVCPATPDGWGSTFGSSRAISLNLGEVLRGDRIQISDYELRMGKDETCRHRCDRKVNRAGIEKARQLIKDGYVVEWIVDNLPGATSFVTVDKSKKYYAAGFKLGYVENDKVYINNHVTMVLRYRKDDKNPGRKVIVAFEVYPKSMNAGEKKCPADLEGHEPFEVYLPPAINKNKKDTSTLTIPFTYSIYWKEDNSIQWKNRWDLYFMNGDESDGVHWMAVMCSLVISMLLSGTVAVIMVRTLSRDIQSYNAPANEEGKVGKTGEEDDDDLMDDTTGWKLVHGDVFRAPTKASFFAPIVGSGVQLFVMGAALLVFSVLGVLNPSYRGGFVSFALFLFVFSGLFSGYYSSRMYKTFKGEHWLQNALLTALLFPGVVISVVFTLNLFVWAQASSSAIPFSTLLALIAMWLFISLPLVLIGGFFGYRKDVWEHPTRTNAIARQIPPQPWYLTLVPSVAIAGLLPFLVIFIELIYVFQSVWVGKGYYYVYGFLAITAVILLATVAEITVVMTYFMLCAENYQWWWRSFLYGASPAIWVFLYSVYYYFTVLHIEGFVSSLLYFAYSALASSIFGLATGTVGVLSAYTFVRKIYGAIKAD